MTTLPRLYPILDLATIRRLRACPVEAARAMVEGGASVVQWRDKGALTRDGLADAERAARICTDAGATFVVNDRADVAMLLQAGLHVGQDDLPALDARRLMGDAAVLGLSTHNAEQLQAAPRCVNYLALGPMFATSSKQNPDPVVGCAQLREWRPLSPLPLVAIGGITRENARDVLEAGADSVAVISSLIPDPYSPLALARRIEEWLELVNR